MTARAAAIAFERRGALGREIPVLVVGADRYSLGSVTDDIDGAFLASDGVERATRAYQAGDLQIATAIEQERVGAPIAKPGKIVCIGLNYHDHAIETGATIPLEPIVFMKDPSTIVGPFDDVRIPRGSTKTDWEVELGVVISRTARYLDSPEQAQNHIAGYVISHDVSEREFQLERGGQWDKGKSCETFNPLGPLLVPRDHIGDPQALGMTLSVNGQNMQRGSSAQMIFSADYVVWYLSQFMVLHPGDLINTGTPAGVALGRAGQPYLRAGDVVELEIAGLGRSRQRFVHWDDQ